MIAVLATATACGGDGGVQPVPPAARGIQFVSGMNATDTVDATLAQPLVVEVRDNSGAPVAAGIEVRFSTLFDGGPWEGLVATDAMMLFDTEALTTTDATGRASARVQLGARARTVRIAVRVPTLQLTDTARFTAQPGTASSLALFPRDTSVYVGRAFTVRGGVVDRHFNVRNDPIDIRVEGSSASLSQGRTLTGNAFGQVLIIGSNATRSDTVSASVVPVGTMLAFDHRIFSLVSVALDGSQVKTYARVVGDGLDLRPRMLPGSDNVIYSGFAKYDSFNNEFVRQLSRVDAAGATSSFLSGAPASLANPKEGAPAASGNWLYFTANNAGCHTDSPCLHRAKLDGTGVELLGDVAADSQSSRQPSPSPDGSKVAFVTETDSGPLIRVFDVGARSTSTWADAGTRPQWSPSGRYIAYQTPDAAVAVINADGTGKRIVRPASSALIESYSWSPDEAWMLLRGVGGLSVVRVATGEAIPLRYLSPLLEVSWK